MRRFALPAVLSVLLTSPVLAADWTQFRGPAASGVTGESELPTEWSQEKNIAWEIDVPGAAWSQPIVLGDRIYLTTAVTENQQKPNVAGGGFGGGRGGPGGFRPGGFGDPRPGQDADRGGKGKADAEAKSRPDEDGKARPEGGKARPADAGKAGGRPGFGGPGGRGFPPGGFGGRGGFGGGRGGFGSGGPPPNDVYQWKVLCLDKATGKVLWEQLAKEAKPTIPTHRTNTFASETPVTDGERLYVYFGMTGLFCYELDGDLVWKKELGSFSMMGGWGTGSSPVVDDERIYIQCDNEEKSFLVAFDKRTGDEVWRVAREEGSNWSTPYLWKNKVRTELVTSGEKMRSYDPATGKLLWEFGGNPGGSRSTPVADDELLYVGAGGGMGGAGPLTAIKAGAEGDITLEGNDQSNDGVAWSIERAGPPMASPLLYEGCVYVLEQRGGIVACYDAKTGEQHYKERIDGATGFTSSPWAYDGKVFCLDQGGQTFVLKPGPKLEVLGTNKLDDQFWSSVAITDGAILLRGVDKLYCIAPQ